MYVSYLFRDTGTKYKTKYRSLIFNIRDPKNPSLFRRIVDGSLSPSELVKLSAEELASQELAKWREQQTQHQLEMIRKSELDLLQMAKSVVMKTHKGEQVFIFSQHKIFSQSIVAHSVCTIYCNCLQEIETESADNVLEIDPNTTVTDLVSALNDSVTSTTLEDTEKIELRELTLKEREQERRQREKEKKRKDDDHDKHHHKHHRDKSDKHRSHKSHSRKSKSKDDERGRDRDRDSKKKERSRSGSRSKRDYKSKEKERALRNSTDLSNSSSSSSKKLVDDKVETYEPQVPDFVEPRKDEIDVSDHEPSSTVTIKTPEIGLEENSWAEDTKVLWRGTMHMHDVARFQTALKPVSGDTQDVPKELPNFIDIVGRISTQLAWDYIGKIKKTKDLSVLRCLCSEENEEQKKSYMKLYSYLSNRNRLGVVQRPSNNVKDFYILPLDKDAPIPAVLQPLDSPGLNEKRYVYCFSNSILFCIFNA